MPLAKLLRFESYAYSGCFLSFPALTPQSKAIELTGPTGVGQQLRSEIPALFCTLDSEKNCLLWWTRGLRGRGYTDSGGLRYIIRRKDIRIATCYVYLVLLVGQAGQCDSLCIGPRVQCVGAFPPSIIILPNLWCHPTT